MYESRGGAAHSALAQVSSSTTSDIVQAMKISQHGPGGCAARYQLQLLLPRLTWVSFGRLQYALACTG